MYEHLTQSKEKFDTAYFVNWLMSIDFEVLQPSHATPVLTTVTATGTPVSLSVIPSGAIPKIRQSTVVTNAKVKL